MKGFLVVFDGCDGSGKGTMVREAKKYLVAKGIPEDRVFTTAEPTHGHYGRKVRELLQSTVNPDVNAQQFLDLYVQDRKEHIENDIRPALAAGKIVLCDRYKYSTFVYQALQGIPLQKIFQLHEGMPIPDISFVLDLPVGEALKRIGRRTKVDTFEHKAFLEKVRASFLRLREMFPHEQIFFIDATKDLHSERQEIGSKIMQKLKEASWA